jgi:hypothetical protein
MQKQSTASRTDNAVCLGPNTKMPFEREPSGIHASKEQAGALTLIRCVMIMRLCDAHEVAGCS